MYFKPLWAHCRPESFGLVKCCYGCCFSFYDHDSATKAIAHANGLKIDGIKIKCNWGRENTRVGNCFT